MVRNRLMLKTLFFSFSVILLVTMGIMTTSAENDSPATGADAISTAFTYQGRLKVDGKPANGKYNFRFHLWAEQGKTTLLGTYPKTSTVELDVVDGYFTVILDFGVGIFDGSERWLEIEVNGTSLSPLQPVTPSPYAIYAQTAPWSGLTGVPAGFADGSDKDTTYTAGDGLTLDVREFNADTNYLQRRVNSGCSPGSSIRVINIDGTVACETDNDTTTFWGLSGSSGTNPATNYLGTADNQPLVLAVNGTQALRLEPTSDSPNIIGGYSGNSITAGVHGAVIGGGGESSYENTVTDHYGTVSGGYGNQAGNNAGDLDDAYGATVNGGMDNKASGLATVSGGWANNASGVFSTVGGGSGNDAGGNYSTMGGGLDNTASDFSSTVSGGQLNEASESYSSVGGGYDNTASGSFSTIPGGRENAAAGDNSFAAGRRAKANHDGAFVWADSKNFDFSSPLGNTFNARATSGFELVAGINDSTGATTWSCYFWNGTSWSCSSDRNQKENFQDVDGQVILENLSRIPVQTWNAKGTDPDVKHLGPTAQDFFTAFGLGNDDKHISTIDLDGVALAAIQGLYALSQEQAEQIASLESENTTLKEQIARSYPGSISSPLTILVYTLAGMVLLLMVGFFWVLVKLRTLAHQESHHDR
ncbi:tail fiber domain-containing protein [Chloroflexota bacterium]